MESMGVATGCGFKEIYRFPHTTYPYSSCICTFLQQHPYFFVQFFKCFSFLYTLKLPKITNILRMLDKTGLEDIAFFTIFCFLFSRFLQLVFAIFFTIFKT